MMKAMEISMAFVSYADMQVCHMFAIAYSVFNVCTTSVSSTVPVSCLLLNSASAALIYTLNASFMILSSDVVPM